MRLQSHTITSSSNHKPTNSYVYWDLLCANLWAKVARSTNCKSSISFGTE